MRTLISTLIALLCFLSLFAQIDTVRVDLSPDSLDRAYQESGASAQALSLYNRGLAEFRKYQVQDAIATFSEVLAMEPDFAKAYYNRAAAHIEAGSYHRATADYDRYLLLSDEPKSDAYFLRARAHHLLDHRSRAIDCYQEAIDRGASAAEAAQYRAELLYQAGRHEEALDDYNRSLRFRPDHAGSLHDRAGTLMALGRIDKAIGDYERAIALDPSIGRAFANLGAAYRKKERYAEALSMLNQAVKLEPNNAVVLNSRGQIHFQQENYLEAERDFREALMKDEKYAFAHNNLAASLIKQERYDEAVKSAGKAIQLQKDYGPAYLNRGIAREMIRDMVGACEDWKKAAELDMNQANRYLAAACKY